MLFWLTTFGPKGIRWRVCADGAFCNKQIVPLAQFIPRLSLTLTMRKNAKLQRPAHTRRYKGKGRRPIYGLPLPKPPQMLADRRRKVHKVRFHSYQGKQEVRRVVEVFGTYSEIAGEMPLRFVLVKPLHKKEDPLFLVTTDLTSSLVEILKDVVSRWTIEVCFREAKQAMGVEKNQVWARESVQRMTPFG